jgi:transposase
VVGYAFLFSIRFDVLASTQAMDRVRCVGQSAWSLIAQVGSQRQNRNGRIHGRCNVFGGKKRGEHVGKTKCGKGTKTMLLTDGNGIPLGTTISTASRNDVRLIEDLLDQRVLRRRVRRLIYDKAADSDPLRKRLKDRGTELITPHQKGRKKPPTQDGRKLRRYRKRWKVERTFSWMQNFRRTITRFEYYAHLFHGFVKLACIMITLNKF